MKISIIIPHHLETKNDMKALLSVLDSQIQVDFNDIEVLFINDEKNSWVDTSGYDNVSAHSKQYINYEYPGYPGMSRQIGIDNAIGDYIMFVDADDVLFSVTTLRVMLNAVESFGDKDIIFFNFVHHRPELKVFYIEKSKQTWLFAKLYCRRFLAEKDIKFIPEIKWHEDTYFNGCALLNAEKTAMLDDVVYVWYYNDKSVTRVNNCEYYFSALPDLIKCNDYLLTYANVHGINYPISHIVGMVTTQYMYCCMINIKLSERKAIEKALSTYLRKWQLKELMLSEQAVPYIMSAQKESNLEYIPREGFYDFINRICEEVTDETDNA